MNKAAKTDTYNKFSKEVTKFGNKASDKANEITKNLKKQGIDIDLKKINKNFNKNSKTINKQDIIRITHEYNIDTTIVVCILGDLVNLIVRAVEK